eukprot:13762-Heterococcus_DN1.PRE.3
MKRTDSTTPIMSKFYRLVFELGEQLQYCIADDKPWSGLSTKSKSAKLTPAARHALQVPQCRLAHNPNFLTEDVNGVKDG